MSISLMAATQLYDYLPAEVALIGSLLASVIAAVIAIRANSQIVAA